MKRTPTSKNPSRPRDPQRRESTLQPVRPAAGASSAASSSRKKVAAKAPATRASASASMDAIKHDRITTIALYALFAVLIIGMIYFFALIFMI